MTETVVHVTTLDEWNSVLNVWFSQGYEWLSGEKGYKEKYFFDDEIRYISVSQSGVIRNSQVEGLVFIEYAEFMAQQEKTMAKETYYVTQEQLDFIDNIKNCAYPADEIVHHNEQIRKMVHYWNSNQDKAVLRYFGGDTSIEFKVKQQLYRLWSTDKFGDKV